MKTKWQFIDPRNRKNYRLFVQCLSVFDQNYEKPKLEDELRQIEQNFYYYCMFEGIDIASEFHLLPEVKQRIREELSAAAEKSILQNKISLMPLTNSDMVFNNHFYKNLLEKAPYS